ncbi:hypothetical protein DV515_00002543, partial [Chloebia gouldiae]
LAAVITAGLLLLYILLCYEDFHFHVAHVYACLGYPNAQHILGQRYLQGAGVEKNEDMAMHWFRQAAGQGHPHSSFNLAVGTLRNMTVALEEGFHVLQGSGETPQCGSSPWAPRSSATFGKHLQEQKPSLNDCWSTDAHPTLPPSALSNPTFSLLSTCLAMAVLAADRCGHPVPPSGNGPHFYIALKLLKVIQSRNGMVLIKGGVKVKTATE